MAKDKLRYDLMVERALRGVVREALLVAAEHGLPGDHHFYLTFRTRFPGVQLPDYLAEQYPSEMTIVLQYQFSSLVVGDDAFEVTLSFNNVPERLVIPFAAVTTFANPSVNFALQFQPLTASEDASGAARVEPVEPPAHEGADAGGAKDKPTTGEVVALDAFRKKT